LKGNRHYNTLFRGKVKKIKEEVLLLGREIMDYNDQFEVEE